MAQQIGFFQDNVQAEEGPFVYESANGFRICQIVKTHLKCNTPLCSDSVNHFVKRAGPSFARKYGVFFKYTKSEAIQIVDWLNDQVRLGHIVEKQYPTMSWWEAPTYMCVE